METNFFDGKRKLQFSKPITILTIVSLVLTVICSLDRYAYYSWGIDGTRTLGFSFGPFGYNILDDLESIFAFSDYLIAVAPVIIFAMYILKFYKQFKADVAMPILLGLIALYPIYVVIQDAILGYGSPSLFYVLVDIAIVISFTLATISSLKGFSKKIYIIIAVACGVLGEFLSLIPYITWRSIYYLEDGLYLFLFTQPLAIIGSVALYIALLLFCLNNKIPAISMKNKKEKIQKKMTPEQSLKYLKEKLDLGTITEEEYQVQRADIISKL